VPSQAEGRETGSDPAMMGNLSERDRKTIRFGGMAAAAIAVLMVLVFPAMDYWTALTKNVDDATHKLQTIKSDVTDAAAAANEQAKLRRDVTLYPDVPSLNRQTAKMLEQIQRLSSYKDLSITRVEGMPLRADEKLVRSSVTIQFSGSLEHLHSLLEQMGKAEPALKVERFTLATGRKVPERIEGQMVISAYAAVTKGKSDERSSKV
jgi:Tfp pilus assembly protein PilO